MLFKYLKVFSWFLFTFGVVLAVATLVGVDLGIGGRRETLMLLTLQIACAGAVLYGFSLHKQNKLGHNALLYGGWGVIVFLIIAGQVALNRGAG